MALVPVTLQTLVELDLVDTITIDAKRPDRCADPPTLVEV